MDRMEIYSDTPMDQDGYLCMTPWDAGEWFWMVVGLLLIMWLVSTICVYLKWGGTPPTVEEVQRLRRHASAARAAEEAAEAKAQPLQQYRGYMSTRGEQD